MYGVPWVNPDTLATLREARPPAHRTEGRADRRRRPGQAHAALTASAVACRRPRDGARPMRAASAARGRVGRRSPGLVHGFFGRRGGVSDGALRSRSTSPTASATTRPPSPPTGARIARRLPGLAIVRMRQVHGDARRARRRAPIRRSARPTAWSPRRRARPGRADGRLRAASSCVAPGARRGDGRARGLARYAGRHRRRRRSTRPDASSASRRPSGRWRMGPSIDGCCYEVEAAIGAAVRRPLGRHAGCVAAGRWRTASSTCARANRQILIANGVAAERIAEVGPCTAVPATSSSPTAARRAAPAGSSA